MRQRGLGEGEEVTRFVYKVFLALNSLSLEIRMTLSGKRFRDLLPVCRETKKGQRIPFALGVSQIPLIQKNQYVRVAYFRVTYTEPLHWLMLNSLLQWD